MKCNTARTQCTIGLARRPCQEVTGWTDLCQSHYDNEYNTYAHEVVWKKIGGVWRRSLGGGSTCAETVLGHNLRHRKSIMDVIVPFIPDSVIALAELYAFRQHLCSGSIDKGSPLYSCKIHLQASNISLQDTVSCSRCGISASVLRYLWVTEAHWCHHCLSIAVNYATVTSVFCIEGPGDLPYISMTMSQTLQTRYKVTWTSAFGAAAHTFRIKTQQGGMYLPIISYIWEDPKDGFWLPTLHLLDGRVVAVGTHSSPDSPPPGTDVKGCQVSITTAEGSTQTSVTTNTVTCQTSAGDDEEQHQPASLEELVSQTSATGDFMREETGPPQLSDGLLAEVMSAIPPQPFSPALPLPPILLPLHSPVDTISHGRQRIPAADRSPSPPVLQREPVSSPLLMHPDFIDEFEILDVWSPLQDSDFLEDEVLSLCVYDTDLDFL
ncbi:hypothetical protein XENOCAPTIV_023670 [Xenoophorus captivus]|uniref:Uncharacterized protein n=1 Tax=Xenoophorus captivus TaxID=1517983 RepID=A0ABV0QT96_9TELE